MAGFRLRNLQSAEGSGSARAPRGVNKLAGSTEVNLLQVCFKSPRPKRARLLKRRRGLQPEGAQTMEEARAGRLSSPQSGEKGPAGDHGSSSSPESSARGWPQNRCWVSGAEAEEAGPGCGRGLSSEPGVGFAGRYLTAPRRRQAARRGRGRSPGRDACALASARGGVSLPSQKIVGVHLT